MDQRPGRRAPDLRRPARRPAQPDGPVRRPRLRRPRPGVPRLDQPAQGADLAAAHARDPALPADPRTRDRPRRRLGSRRLNGREHGRPGSDRDDSHRHPQRLRHVLEHSGVDEPSCRTSLAYHRSRVIVAADVDNATLQRLSNRGRPADLAWEARVGLATAMPSCSTLPSGPAEDGRTEAAEWAWRQAGRPCGLGLGSTNAARTASRVRSSITLSFLT